MRRFALAAILVTGTPFVLETPGFAHGAVYRPQPRPRPPENWKGPVDTVPRPGTPARPRPSQPGPLAPGAGPLAPGGTNRTKRPTTQGASFTRFDLTVWSVWWELNKAPYLNLKAHIHTGVSETGSDRFFLGRGGPSSARATLRPTEGQIREKVVPALLAALERETNNDIVTGCLIALAKIGDANPESGLSELEGVIQEYLSDSNQEIRETAAVALGILANDASVDTLAALLMDTEEGRKLVGSTNIDPRTRAFAAYGLGLIGAATTQEEKRQEIVRILAETIATDDTKSRDLEVSCIIAMGLVPLQTIQPPSVARGAAPPPHESRIGQLTYLLDYLRDEENRFLVRAHCPTALARLVNHGGLPAELHEHWREEVAKDLRERAGKRSKEQAEVVQSSVLALGLLGTNGEEDEAIRDALEAIPKDVADQQARNFSMIAMARVGGTIGRDDIDAGIDQASEFLLDHLSKGKSTIRPWAGLGIGVMSRELGAKAAGSGKVGAMADALRTALREEKDAGRVAAYAIAAGIMGDVEATDTLLEKLDGIREDEPRGHVAVALGLMSSREAIAPIREIVQESKYRPRLLEQAAIGLGLLGDHELVPDLVEMLSEAKGLATQAAISSALGFIGDQRSIDPLVEMLEDERVTPTARAFAAVALGIVADKEPLPWNTKIALDLNYRASTQTLVDAQAGTGILDIL